MKILKDEKFLHSLQSFLTHIVKDSVSQAIIFDDELNHAIENLVDMPYKFRQSYFYDNKNVRDLIYKGYVVPYLVDSENDVLVVLNIFKNRPYY